MRLHRLTPCLAVLAILMTARVASANVIFVDDLGDPAGPTGTCTLRQATIAANTNALVAGSTCAAGDDLDIGFGPNDVIVFVGTVTLAIPGANEDASATGDLDITGPTVIGCNDGTIDAGTSGDRVFHVLSTGNLTLNNGTIQNGVAAYGGGIFNAGTLAVANSFLVGNVATGGDGGVFDAVGAAGGGGGAIYNGPGGALTLTNVDLISNAASGGDGGFAGGAGGGGGGGAGGAGIFNDGGTIVGADVVISFNGAVGGNGGDAAYCPDGASGAGGGGFSGGGGLGIRLRFDVGSSCCSGSGAPGFGGSALGGGGGGKGLYSADGAAGGAAGFGSGGGGGGGGDNGGFGVGGAGGTFGGSGGTGASWPEWGGGGGAAGLGGGLYSSGGSVSLSTCTIIGNAAGGGSGGSGYSGGAPGGDGSGLGAGVFQTGTGSVSLDDCVLGDAVFGNVIDPDAVCGNTFLELGEECDDGGTIDETNGCDSNCTITACGNGIPTTGEDCDTGGNTAACDADCTIPACADGVFNPTVEACDDGNLFDGDTCDPNCELPGCGNDYQDFSEGCDDGNLNELDGCDPNCLPQGCGNDYQDATEACEDGNPVDGDGCDNNCTFTACGNDVLTPTTGEQCDDGGTISGDGCSDVCVLTDYDSDGVDNAVDNCPFVANPGTPQADADGDGQGDACDGLDNDNPDGDGFDNAVDNCPFVANNQADADGDGVGDACDPTDGNDVDGDGDDNVDDNCPFEANADQADADGDDLGDVCDPLDDDDVDGDGDDNVADNCPFDANADQADADADGLGDACDPANGGADDLDGDGEDNDTDNCPFVSNDDQDDGDEDGLGDACDDLDNADVDGDGETNVDDNCPFVANDDQEDVDGDGLGDACDDVEDEDQSVVVNGTGCDAGGGGGLGGLALLGFVLLLLTVRPEPRERKRARVEGRLMVLLVLLAPVTAAAQTTFDAQLDPDRFLLTSDPTSVGLTESADPLANRTMAVGLALRLGGAPLTVCVEDENGDCEVEGDIVSDRIGMDLTYAIGFGRFGAHAQLPLILHQSSDFGPSMGEEALASGGVGDLRLGGKAWLFRKSGLTLGADLTFSLPTNSGSFTGDAGTVIEPRGLVTWRKDKISVAGSLGYGLRTSDQTVADLHVDDELLLAVAGEYAVLPDKLGVGLALTSRVGLIGTSDDMMDPTSDAERLTEALASTRYWLTDAIAIEGGLGTALEGGYGAPSYRVLAGVRWTHQPKEPPPPPPEIPDTDHDGLLDPDDQCVTDPEDKDSVEDTDGCPEDDDKDGIADVVDDCRTVPEDADGVEDDDGCPEDDDRDGIADAVDECRAEPEDPDAFEDENGCPDPDNDQDGILDGVDGCPLEPETMNGFEDENGCPDDVPIIVQSFTGVIAGINFQYDSAKILKSSNKVLDAAVQVLIDFPSIRLEVQGHTDDQGKRDHNLWLSQARAESVVKYLVDHGVDAARLTAKGYGPDVPLIAKTTKAARAKNRRVEFIIVQ